jgi:hypothetical protein
VEVGLSTAPAAIRLNRDPCKRQHLVSAPDLEPPSSFIVTSCLYGSSFHGSRMARSSAVMSEMAVQR